MTFACILWQKLSPAHPGARDTRPRSLVSSDCVSLCLSCNGHTYNLDAPEPSNPSEHSSARCAPHHSTTFHNCRFEIVATSSHAQMLGIRCCQHVVLSVMIPDHSGTLRFVPVFCLQFSVQGLVFASSYLSRSALLCFACPSLINE